MTEGWTWSDAWVFASLDGSSSAARYSLRQVIGNADHLNHAILMEAEFSRSMARLVAAGICEVDVPADRYWLTKAGQALSRRPVRSRGRSGWLDTVLPGLRSLGEPAGADLVGTGWPPLLTDAFAQAIDDYTTGR